MDDQVVIGITRRWISAVVIGLNLCPFARRVFVAERIRYTVTDAGDEETLLAVLAAELRTLVATPTAQIETAFVIHPRALPDFRDYNDFVERADELVRDLGLRGVVQIAGFHPGYQFAGTDPGAVENYTNRSPYPMLHLLREESVSAVAGEPDALLDIPQRNIETLRKLGRAKVVEMLRAVERDSPQE